VSAPVIWADTGIAAARMAANTKTHVERHLSIFILLRTHNGCTKATA
jgi:hypothetical protein